MKPFFSFVLLAIVILLFGQCTQQQDLAFDYPAAATTDTGRANFREHWSQGKVLYAMNCGGCHDTLVAGSRNKVVPDFSLPQLLDYEMRFQYPSHENRLREVDVSVAELDWIQMYLQYKKRSGVPVAPLPVGVGAPRNN